MVNFWAILNTTTFMKNMICPLFGCYLEKLGKFLLHHLVTLPVVNVIKLFLWKSGKSRFSPPPPTKTTGIGHLKSNKQFESIVLCKNSQNSFHSFVQVQTSEQA